MTVSFRPEWNDTDATQFKDAILFEIVQIQVSLRLATYGLG
jgi:hypothetical protein